MAGREERTDAIPFIDHADLLRIRVTCSNGQSMFGPGTGHHSGQTANQPPQLTQADRDRIEASRLAALERRRQKQLANNADATNTNTNILNGVPNVASKPWNINNSYYALPAMMPPPPPHQRGLVHAVQHQKPYNIVASDYDHTRQYNNNNSGYHVDMPQHYAPLPCSTTVLPRFTPAPAITTEYPTPTASMMSYNVSQQQNSPFLQNHYNYHQNIPPNPCNAPHFEGPSSGNAPNITRSMVSNNNSGSIYFSQPTALSNQPMTEMYTTPPHWKMKTMVGAMEMKRPTPTPWMRPTPRTAGDDNRRQGIMMKKSAKTLDGVDYSENDAVPSPVQQVRNGPRKKISLKDKKPYGPSSTFTFTRANDIDVDDNDGGGGGDGGGAQMNDKRKKLTQSTLGQTMKRYRESKSKEERNAAEDTQVQPDVKNFDPAAPVMEDEGGHAAALLRDTPSSTTTLRKTLFNSSFYSTGTVSEAVTVTATGAEQNVANRMNDTIGNAATSRCIIVDNASIDTGERWSWLKNRRDAQGNAPDDINYDPRTLFIPPHAFSSDLKGFNAQYWSIKKDAMDLVLFVRVGSFYELYDEDADIGLSVGLNPVMMMTHGKNEKNKSGTTTSNDIKGNQTANMWKAGCTASAFAQWAAKVLAFGHSVGRVEEFRNRSLQILGGRKLVARELVQVYTPGTAALALSNGRSCFDGEVNNRCWSNDDFDLVSSSSFLVLYEGVNGLLAACAVDVVSCTLSFSQWQEVDAGRSLLCTLLAHINPIEVVILHPKSITIDTKKALMKHKPLIADGVEKQVRIILLHKNKRNRTLLSLLLDLAANNVDRNRDIQQHIKAIYFSYKGNKTAFDTVSDSLCAMSFASIAFCMALAHLQSTGTATRVLPHASISSFASFTPNGARATGHMLLDATAIGSLELVENSLGGMQGSLVEFLSAGTATAAGRRRIKEWILAPLYRIGDINARLDVVSAFMQMPEAVGLFQTALLGIGADCERLLPKVATLLSDIAGLRHTNSDGEHDYCSTTITPQDDGQSDYSRGYDSCDSYHRNNDTYNESYNDPHDPLSSSSLVSDPSRFLPAMKLFQGICAMLDALNSLKNCVNGQRPGGSASMPPLTRALCYAADISSAAARLGQLFHSSRLSKTTFRLIPGVCERYDKAHREKEQAQKELDSIVEQHRQDLIHLYVAAEHHKHNNNKISSAKSITKKRTAALAKKIKLVDNTFVSSRDTDCDDDNDGDIVDYKTKVLLEVPKILESTLDTFIAEQTTTKSSESSQSQRANTVFVSNKTKTMVRLAIPAITSAYNKLESAIQAQISALLCHVVENSRLFLESYQSFLGFCSSIATLDALASLAECTHPQAAAPSGSPVLSQCTFSRPVFTTDTAGAKTNSLALHGLWNPQLKACRSPSFSLTSCDGWESKETNIKIQPNDVILQNDEQQHGSTLILTGANTGGKSTLLRSVCVAVVMAQIGAYVPCTAAQLTPVDRIFTRMGAHDRIAAGESTFCVEMTETASVLRHAQSTSLVVLDELGRGTSTHDGHAIASAVACWLTKNTKCRLLFATHYHDIARDAEILGAGALVCHMASHVDTSQCTLELIPSYQLRHGPAPDGSCGVFVASSAGLPPKVVERAKYIVRRLANSQKNLSIRSLCICHHDNNSTNNSDILETMRLEVIMALRKILQNNYIEKEKKDGECERGYEAITTRVCLGQIQSRVGQYINTQLQYIMETGT